MHTVVSLEMEPTGEQDQGYCECQCRHYRLASSIAKVVKITETECCVVIIVSARGKTKWNLA